MASSQPASQGITKSEQPNLTLDSKQDQPQSNDINTSEQPKEPPVEGQNVPMNIENGFLSTQNVEQNHPDVPYRFGYDMFVQNQSLPIEGQNVGYCSNFIGRLRKKEYKKCPWCRFKVKKPEKVEGQNQGPLICPGCKKEIPRKKHQFGPHCKKFLKRMAEGMWMGEPRGWDYPQFNQNFGPYVNEIEDQNRKCFTFEDQCRPCGSKGKQCQMKCPCQEQCPQIPNCDNPIEQPGMNYSQCRTEDCRCNPCEFRSRKEPCGKIPCGPCRPMRGFGFGHMRPPCGPMGRFGYGFGRPPCGPCGPCRPWEFDRFGFGCMRPPCSPYGPCGPMGGFGYFGRMMPPCGPCGRFGGFGFGMYPPHPPHFMMPPCPPPFVPMGRPPIFPPCPPHFGMNHPERPCSPRRHRRRSNSCGKSPNCMPPFGMPPMGPRHMPPPMMPFGMPPMGPPPHHRRHRRHGRHHHNRSPPRMPMTPPHFGFPPMDFGFGRHHRFPPRLPMMPPFGMPPMGPPRLGRHEHRRHLSPPPMNPFGMGHTPMGHFMEPPPFGTEKYGRFGIGRYPFHHRSRSRSPSISSRSSRGSSCSV